MHLHCQPASQPAHCTMTLVVLFCPHPPPPLIFLQPPSQSHRPEKSLHKQRFCLAMVTCYEGLRPLGRQHRSWSACFNSCQLGWQLAWGTPVQCQPAISCNGIAGSYASARLHKAANSMKWGGAAIHASAALRVNCDFVCPATASAFMCGGWTICHTEISVHETQTAGTRLLPLGLAAHECRGASHCGGLTSPDPLPPLPPRPEEPSDTLLLCWQCAPPQARIFSSLSGHEARDNRVGVVHMALWMHRGARPPRRRARSSVRPGRPIQNASRAFFP